MLLGAIVLKLVAQNAGSLPQYHGRLLHAAFLTMVRNADSSFSALMHDVEVKSFSLGLLRFARENLQGRAYKIAETDAAYMRIAGLGDDVVNYIFNISNSGVLRIGKINFKIAAVYKSRHKSSEAGLTSIEDISTECRSLPPVRRVTLNFITPAVFKYFDNDYPLPKPELVFGSLAERWNNVCGREYFDSAKVKEIAAAALIPDNWIGETKRIRHGKNRYITGFTGRFTYRLDLLPEEYRLIFIMLAEFAVFSGAGALTGQGFGRVTIKYQ